ncbi:MAG TPA: hypothetical protein P5511_00445 [Candidatus Goldiibacteriota bacterium]|nr:hypothetical protein [Candidatus Goldiibacteriota bacterium]
MKKKAEIAFVAVILLAAFSRAFCAEIVEETTVLPAVARTPAPMATAQRTPAPQPSADYVKTIETMVADINDLKSRIDALNKSQASLRDSIRVIEEKSIEYSSAAADISLYKKDLEAMSQKSAEERKKTADLEKQFSEISDTLKQRVDKMRGWDDILDVLKNEISNNEREIARLKKEINALKKQYGAEDENIFNVIAQWPYAGITALVISIAAFITVMAAK